MHKNQMHYVSWITAEVLLSKTFIYSSQNNEYILFAYKNVKRQKT